MMRFILFFALYVFTPMLYANGLDNMEFMVKGKVVGAWAEGLPARLDSLKNGDTLAIIFNTDWGGENGAYVELIDTISKRTIDTITGYPRYYPFAAHYVLNTEKVSRLTGGTKANIQVVLHYRPETKLEPVVTGVITLQLL